jgi:predicted Ser/Thr protein kinase
MDSSIAEPLGTDDPREIGTFPIIGRLGVGGMGEVYLGTRDGRYVAVKRVRPHQVSRERFEREVAVLSRVPAGVAPHVLAHDSTAEYPWFATEYVPGLTLHDAVRLHGPLAADALRRLLAETVAALHVVHAAKIVHRDLTPANLMLVHDGVRLIDFGIARAADLPRLTRHGAGCGTPGFSAPEQEHGDSNVASPADVYALGAVVLFAATGREPGDAPDPAPLREIDAGLAAVVESCLVTLPSARPTAARLVEAARGLGGGGDGSWPAGVAERIEARCEFAATSLGKLETLAPGPGPTRKPDPEPDREPDANRRRPPPSAGDSRLDAAAGELAGKVRKQWEREERARRVHDPYPLPVRFGSARAGLFDHWANIRRTGRGTDPGPLPLAGGLDEVAAGYGSIPSGRLVLLGRAGSGKTIMALRFVLDRLDGYGPGDRVPVIFSLGSWDPTAVSLRDWMRRRLVRDYNALEAPADGGGNTAAALIDDDRILPVLDGFDEIASGLQGAALAALNDYAGPLLLTSRPAEYATAVQRNDVLTAAACVELEALAPGDVDEYLTRASRPGADPAPRTVWEPVLSRLRERPRSEGAADLADALGTPLMVALARAVYSDTAGRDPAELLDTDRFRSADAVQEHLLAEFVPARYPRLPADAETAPAAGPRRPRRWDGERAEHWLGYLAWHLEQQGRHDLAWWELGTAMGQRSLMLVVGVMVGIASGLVAGLVYGSAAALASGPVSGLGTAVVSAVVNGLGVGLTFGLMHGFASNLKVGGPAFEPSHMRIRLRGGMRRKLLEGFWPRISGGFVGGVLFGGLWAGWAAFSGSVFPDGSPVSVAVAARDDLALGTGLGVAIGLVAAVGSGLEAVSEREKAARPAALLTKNRINVLTQLLAVAVVIGIGYGAVLGPAPGLAAGLIVALGLGTMTAWGRWVVLARIWLPLRGRAPWAMAAFLEDAYERGVLRQAGAVYQFRHARVQIQLAQRFAAAARTDTREEKQA